MWTRDLDRIVLVTPLVQRSPRRLYAAAGGEECDW